MEDGDQKHRMNCAPGFVKILTIKKEWRCFNMTITSIQSLRWNPYFIRRGIEFSKFWDKYLQNEKRNVLYVLGRGFDPRMCTGFEAILKAGRHGVRDCLLIEFSEGEDSPSMQHTALVSDNLNILNDLLKDNGKLLPKPVQMWSGDGPGRRRIGSRNAAGIFSDISDFATYTDIIIDISSMPRCIYFPLIGKALYLLDQAKRNNIINLHVVVCENVKLDQNIRDVGIDETASYLHGFGGLLETEATAGTPKVWIPILGEDQRNQLEKIYALVDPDEICPVLPSPSLNPRRGDVLIFEYRELLFDQWRVEPRNVIYASEQNPFEAYRQIHQAVCHYNQALKLLGGCKAVLSSLSSKLLSIGALLAAYELMDNGLNVGIAHVEAQGHEIDTAKNGKQLREGEELFTILLAGN